MGTQVQTSRSASVISAASVSSPASAIFRATTTADADAAAGDRGNCLSYAIAGADILETNTFSSTRIAQADYGMQDVVYELNRDGARLAPPRGAEAERLDGRARFVAGALGPTNRTASLSPDVNNPGFRAVTFDDLREAYAQQIVGLLDGGADIIPDRDDFRHAQRQGGAVRLRAGLRTARAAVAADDSGTITDRSGRTLSGQTPTAFWHSVRHARPLLDRPQLRARRHGDARTSRGDLRVARPSSPPTPTRATQ